MAMLAEPRRKQKWTLNPRGKQWSDDSNKFGQKMLEKMGWKSGKGLGANEQGMTEHVRVKFKDDSGGIGYSKDNQDKNWTEHQESYNDILQKLGSAQGSDKIETSEVKDSTELSGKSLELKSQQSRARVHYRKFTRGKDVNKYSAKDLANIFGKKDLSDMPNEEKKNEEVAEEVSAPIGSADTTGGVLTFKGGNINDYFKKKIPILSMASKKPSNENDGSESENERYVGFGFSSSKPSELPEQNGVVNPALDFKDNSKDNTPRKRKSEFYCDNPVLDSNAVDEQTPKKRKTDYSFENAGLDITCSDKTFCGRTKLQFVRAEDSLRPAIECIPQENEDVTESNKKKKKKKKKETVEGFVNDALNLETKVEVFPTGETFEVTRPDCGLANDALDLTDESSGKKRVTFNDKVEYSDDSTRKKKSKVKLDKFEVEDEKLKKKKKKKRDVSTSEGSNVFFNEALDVEIINEEVNDNEENEKKSKKSKRKRDRKTLNLETIEETPEEDKDAIEEDVNETTETPTKRVKKSSEIINSIIDTSEVEEVEISSEKKLKRKKKKKNEEMVEVEVVHNVEDSNEKKKGKKKKKKRQDGVPVENEVENSEAVQEENSNKENVEDVIESDSSKKKLKKSKKNKKVEGEDTEVAMEVVHDDEESKVSVEENKEAHEATKTSADENARSSPWQMRSMKPKKIFKSLFAKNPVLHFAGSNINDIKGYGVDV